MDVIVHSQQIIGDFFLKTGRVDARRKLRVSCCVVHRLERSKVQQGSGKEAGLEELSSGSWARGGVVRILSWGR